MPITDPSERVILGSGLLALGCAFAALGSALAARAFDHMLATASLCGPAYGHCPACVGSVVCLAAALAAGGAGLSLLQPRRSRVAAARG